MDGRVVVVTGATGKLGPAVAQRFAAAGDRLVLVARDRPMLDGLVSALPGGADRHLALDADLLDPAVAAGLPARIATVAGPAQVVLHLVGTYLGGHPMEAGADEEWTTLLEDNLWTTVRVLRAFLPVIRSTAGGRLVTVSTPLAMAPVGEVAAYAASKAAVESLTLSVARELADTDATANVVLVRTIGDAKRSHTRPAEVAAAMEWLCSPAAAAVNGQRIPVVGRG
jgi:NAD(P)-dependent dehydrogenase (short-subunit alcohol dehydrogenase family)